MRTALVAAALLAAAVSARAGSLSARTAPSIPDSALMIDAQSLAKDPIGDALMTEPVDLAAGAGVKWARVFVDWVNVEFTAGVYDFSGLDPLINRLQAANMKVLLTITGNYGGTQQLYAGGNAPTNANGGMTPWLNFVTATVNHYPQAGAFEVWNEPNLSWSPTINAADYASLAIQTADKIHSLRPGATVVLGGTSLIDKTFSQAVLAAGACSHVDAFAFHPYRLYPEQAQDPFVTASGFSPNTSFVSMGAASYEEEVGQIKQWLSAAGCPNLPLWADETGYPSQLDSHVPGSATVQAKNLARYEMLNLGLGIAKSSWFQLYDANSAQGNYYTPAGQGFTDDYRNVTAPFSTFGLTYSAPGASSQVGAGAYTSSLNVSVTAGTMTATNANNFATYTITPPAAGKYFLWARLKSVSTPDPGATQSALLDSNNWAYLFWTVNGSSYTVVNGLSYNYFSYNVLSPLLQSRYTSAALLDYYWAPIAASAGSHPQIWYPIPFDLPAGASTFSVKLQNAAVSELRLYPKGALTPKLGGAALQWLASLFDDRVGVSPSLGASFSQGTLSGPEWAAFRSARLATRGGVPVIAYWTGVQPVDAFTEKNASVRVSAPIPDAVLIDPLAGTYASVSADGSNTFTVRVQDYPLILTSLSALDKSGGQLLLAEETYNFPNPARGDTTTLRFYLNQAADVRIEIMNEAHARIWETSLSAPAGKTTVPWSVAGVANGVYFMKVTAGGQTVVKKILILR